jgi:hypothetical protein
MEMIELSAGKVAHAKVTIRNTGSIPAKKVHSRITGWLSTENCPEPTPGITRGIDSEATIAVNAERVAHAYTPSALNEQDMKLIDAGIGWFYMAS